MVRPDIWIAYAGKAAIHIFWSLYQTGWRE
jgi:hypothetical protein